MIKQILLTGKTIARRERRILFPLFLFLCILEMWQSLAAQLGIIGVLLMITLVAVGHAEVVSGLKITDQVHEPLDIRKDAFCGISRIKELFSTYMWIEGMVLLGLILVFFIFNLIVSHGVPDSFWQTIFLEIENEVQYGISETWDTLFSWFMMFFVVANTVIGYFVHCLFFLAPYYLEMYSIRGLAALKAALKNGRGHWKQIFTLQAHYYILIIFFSCLDYLITLYVPFALLSVFLSFGLIVLQIYIYRMDYAVSKALLFKEITQND